MIRAVTIAFFLITGQLSFSQQRVIGLDAAFKFVDSVFTSPTVAFEINELRASDSLEDIMIRLNNAMAENKEWFADYMNKNYKPGEGTPYTEKMGITKEEYNKIKNSDKSSYKLHKVRTELLRVTKSDLSITFKGNDSFRILNYLMFRREAKTVTFVTDTVLFAGEINTPTATPFGTWHGYRWNYEKSNQKSDADIDIHKLSATIIEVDIGRTIPGNKFFLRLEYKQTEQGETNANMDLMGFIN